MANPDEATAGGPLEAVELTTARLRLRSYAVDDARVLARLAGDRAVALTTTAIPHPYPVDAAVKWIAGHEPAREKGTELPFAIALRSTGELAGGIGLTVQREHGRAELGYWIAVPHWGRGFATEAAAAVVEHGFRGLGLDRIYAHNMTRNPASGRVLEKLGLRPEGTLRAHILKWGSFEDIALWGLLRSDWESS